MKRCYQSEIMVDGNKAQSIQTATRDHSYDDNVLVMQDCDNVKASQSWNHFETKGFIVHHPLTVEIHSGPEKEVAPLSVCAKHCYLYLVIIAVSTLQLDTELSLKGKSIRES